MGNFRQQVIIGLINNTAGWIPNFDGPNAMAKYLSVDPPKLGDSAGLLKLSQDLFAVLLDEQATAIINQFSDRIMN